MAVERGQTGVLAANADSGNVLTGKTFDQVPITWRRGANIRVAAIAGLAASLNATASFKVGQTAHGDKISVPYDSVARGVKMSDDVIIDGVFAPPGAKLYLNFNGGAAGAAAPGINWAMEIYPA